MMLIWQLYITILPKFQKISNLDYNATIFLLAPFVSNVLSHETFCHLNSDTLENTFSSSMTGLVMMTLSMFGTEWF